MNFITQYLGAFKIAGALAIALAIFGTGWTTNGWRLNKDAVEKETQHAQEVIALQNAARKKEQEWSKQQETARNEATKRETTLRADADAARQSVISLRDQLAANKRAMPGAAADAVSQYASTLSDVFGECADKYRELAEEADRLAIERQTLIDSWPK